MKKLRYYIPTFKLNVLDIEFNVDGKWTTVYINALKIEFSNATESSLLDFGWYQGSFYWDLLYLSAIQRKYDDWKDSRA